MTDKDRMVSVMAQLPGKTVGAFHPTKRRDGWPEEDLAMIEALVKGGYVVIEAARYTLTKLGLDFLAANGHVISKGKPRAENHPLWGSWA